MMFKDTVSDNAKFWRYSAILLVSGFGLFVLGVFVYSPFRDLAMALNSKEGAPPSVWLLSGGLAFLFGSLWLCFFILFEAAKKGIVDLMHKK